MTLPLDWDHITQEQQNGLRELEHTALICVENSDAMLASYGRILESMLKNLWWVTRRIDAYHRSQARHRAGGGLVACRDIDCPWVASWVRAGEEPPARCPRCGGQTTVLRRPTAALEAGEVTP
jgi:hypothetical protein